MAAALYQLTVQLETVLSQAERERERLRQKELQLRSEERFRMEELERERQRQKAIHRKQREEAMQLEREKEKLRWAFHGIVLKLREFLSQVQTCLQHQFCCSFYGISPALQCYGQEVPNYIFPSSHQKIHFLHVCTHTYTIVHTCSGLAA